jgi:hypothetical protein
MLLWLENYLLRCPIKQYYGIDCPGCGLQRSFLLLLQGQVWESIKMYPALLPMLFLGIFTAIHIKWNLKNGAKWIVFLYILIACIVLAHYAWKLSFYFNQLPQTP